MLAKWFETTSLTGAIDLYESRSSKPQLIFWSLIMLTMISCCVYFTYKTVEDYIVQPTQTSFKTQQVGNMEMPEVLICFNGGYNVAAMMQAGFTINFISNFVGSLKYGAIDRVALESTDKELKNYLKQHNINMKSFMQKFTYSCNDIFAKAAYGISCNNTSQLYSDNFGQCHVFRNISNQYYPGIDGGFQIKLKTPPNSFYEFSPELATEYDFSNSFYVSLDKQFSWITRRFLLIPANVRAEITLHPTRYIRLASNNPCDDGTDIYSSNTCFHRCYAEAFYKYCGCYLLEYLEFPEKYNNTNICALTDVKCKSYDMNLAQPCQMQCRPKCEEWVYGSKVTYAFLEPKPINESFSIVFIGYDTMEYMQVEEVDTFTVHIGLANVGGQAGLWLGVSIVTIIQAIYYLYIAIYQKCYGFILLKRAKEKDMLSTRSNEMPMPLSENGVSSVTVVKY